MAGVEVVRLKGELGGEAVEKKNKKAFEKSIEIGFQYFQAMEKLKGNGFFPDIIISHSGWGCGLHSLVVWPNARRISYLEWWFDKNCKLYEFGAKSKWMPARNFTINERLRNSPLSLELVEADIIISPTEWQKRQLPKQLQISCRVISDGVNLKRYAPDEKKEKKEKILLTYGTRGMEPMRGFPEFIEELEEVLVSFPSLEVEIAGDDRIVYDGSAPQGYTSYKTWAEDHLSKFITKKRIAFIGLLQFEEYQKWLRNSTVHVYLTRPFVASWSLLEAMASGCAIIASNTEPVKEFLTSDEAILVDYREPGWLKKSLVKLINDERLSNRLSKNARLKSLEYSAEITLRKWEGLIEELRK
ncbi:Glycosyl transferases group 1 [Prochlorococcus marinus str. MIT 1320]|nr:Glycosyl transferases group 1 [Prochlorococcus marinus str. MIT 1320]